MPSAQLPGGRLYNRKAASNKVELSALSNIDLNVFVNLYTSVLICDNVTEAEAVGAVEGGGSAPGGQP